MNFSDLQDLVLPAITRCQPDLGTKALAAVAALAQAGHLPPENADVALAEALNHVQAGDSDTQIAHAVVVSAHNAGYLT